MDHWTIIPECLVVQWHIRCDVQCKNCPGDDDIFPSDDNNVYYTTEIIYISSIFVDKGLVRTVLFQKRWTLQTTFTTLDYIVISCTMCQDCSDKILVQLTVSSRLSDVSQINNITSGEERTGEDVTAWDRREVPGGRLQGGRMEHGRGHVRSDCCCGTNVNQKSHCEER